MTSRGVSLLKFVGTVSLGLLTGLSCSLAAVTVPSILSLPSASSAARAYRNLAPTSSLRLRSLTTVSSASFLLAFYLSPRSYRHPYLIYASTLALASSFADQIAPYILGSSDDEASREETAARRQARHERLAARNAARAARMEASYEVVGDVASEEGTGSASGGDDFDAEEEEEFNGEEVRGEIEDFLKAQRVQTGIASVGFLLSLVGVWGDGALKLLCCG
ncbi:hypothetical protein SODALDRAFT_331927 [Sodiomyces alkalinus F11]|uniref:Autophagy-related protein 33 n=1 Tax=Sodiomyces alkalinus (strain CBS 110278 / VKM F-3762 / F11) TaxID=1314773 RepID=A0A3N2PZF4_SODAK|nr:hypothetical protein SODALDRAFT_331927 [Sodiomyces alkalinus F11]ROT39808.1 hypothetical protein SODALDRAFT_331927 [Sodiomyces alkalinus F11]